MKLIQVKESKLQRLDIFLAKREKISRNQIQKLIKSGHIRVNSQRTKPGYILEINDIISIEDLDKSLKKTKMPLDIVYEDGDILVVNKSQGLTVHPNAHNQDQTLVNGLLYYTDKLGRLNSQRPGIVHRLDKETSGLILIGKTDQAIDRLMEDFKVGRVVRIYRGICHGHIGARIVDEPIGRDYKTRIKMARRQSGRPSQTIIRPVDYFSNYSLVEYHLLTGRTHQIRVHSQYIGHPIVGDQVYGRTRTKFVKMMLHASVLGFNHPGTGAYMELRTENPKRFNKFMEKEKMDR